MFWSNASRPCSSVAPGPWFWVPPCHATPDDLEQCFSDLFQHGSETVVSGATLSYNARRAGAMLLCPVPAWLRDRGFRCHPCNSPRAGAMLL
eukprot:gene9667-8490_t